MSTFVRELTGQPMSSYVEFVHMRRESCPWVQYLSMLTATHSQWLRVVAAYSANLENGMIESEAAYHALVNEGA